MGLRLLTVFGLLLSILGSYAGLNLPANEPVLGFGLTNFFPALRFDSPVGIISAPGETERLFIVEKTGRIVVISDLSHPSKSVFLDLSNSTFASTEAGLLGLAFHPGFATNGRFFVYRTKMDPVLHDVLSEFRCDPPSSNFADASTERILIRQPDGSDTHNAGQLAFGPDGYLYFSIGDETPLADDQHETLQAIDKGFFGGIMRIDVDGRAGNLRPNPHESIGGEYWIPADNPFIGITAFNGLAVDPSRVRTEFYAAGLRNPWRFSFDAETGRLFCADVGAGAFEEIDIVERGGNYGWPYIEADSPAPGITNDPPAGLRGPIYSYRHGNGAYDGNCVIGGVISRGSSLPQLSGKYVFGDFSTGNIWALDPEHPSETPMWLTASQGISSFGVHPGDGGILVANHERGTILRLVYKPASESNLPGKLSEAGAFLDLRSMTPAATALPYQVNTPFWSDGAIKQRWVDLSGSTGKVEFAAATPWKVPPGAVWIKHFDLEMTNGAAASRRRVETRFIVKTEQGVYGLTYQWDSAQEDAVLVPPAGTNATFLIHDNGMVRTQTWVFPGWDQCNTCHNDKGGWALSFNTLQLNQPGSAGGIATNQLDWLALKGIFSNPQDIHSAEVPALSSLDDPHAPAQYKVRSYLESNCAQCHQPDGLARAAWDGRISMPLADAKIVGAPASFYPPPMKIIDPGAPDNSYIFTRVQNRVPLYQMPPLATTEVDQKFVNVLSNWITSFPPAPWISTNIGPSLAEGAAEVRPNGFRIYSAGSGAGADSVFFLSRPARGSVGLSASISNLDAAARGAEAGLMVREKLEPGGAFAALVYSDGRYSLIVRPSSNEGIRVSPSSAV